MVQPSAAQGLAPLKRDAQAVAVAGRVLASERGTLPANVEAVVTGTLQDTKSGSAYAFAAFGIAQVIDALGMVPGFPIHDAVEGLQFVVRGKDGIDVGAVATRQLDPNLRRTVGTDTVISPGR